MSEAKKRTNSFQYLNKYPNFQRKRLKSLLRRPTKPEAQLARLVRRNKLPYRYVGDGSVIIGKLNPDFIHNNGKKKVIEAFGRIYHDPDASFFPIDWKRQPFGRISYYAQFGYGCLILWDDELEDEERVIEKIKQFEVEWKQEWP